MRRGSGMVAATICAVLAAGAGTARAGTPPLTASALVLTAADVPGATVAKQRAVKPSGPITSEYERELKFATPYGASKYVAYADVAFVISNEEFAKLTYAIVAKAFSSAKGRQTLLATFFGPSAKAGSAKTSHLSTHPLAVGDSGMEISWTEVSGGAQEGFSFTLYRLDRVLELGVAIGAGTPTAADATALANLVLGHVRTALVPANTAVPTIAGTAQQGQTLTASPGTWTNTPVFTYQWQRCDATGANCVDVTGATQATYAVAAADAGTTLRVNVTGANRLGSATASSAVTAAVT